MKSKLLTALVLALILACNPYKGFKGVSTKGMKKGSTPSQDLKDDYGKRGKKMKKSYKREMKRKKKRLGTKE